jgi:hypothetical protein
MSKVGPIGRLFVVALVAAVVASVVVVTRGGAETSPEETGLGHAHPTMPVGLHAHRKVLHDGVSPDPTGRLGAGGTAVAHRPGAQPITSARVLGGAPKARMFRTGFDSWEPTMGVTKKGVFFNALGENGSRVIRSTDRGKSWKQVFDEHIFTADPYMFVDQDTDRIFTNDYVPPCHLVSFSDDEGKTWTSGAPAGCYDNADHQTLFAGPPPEGGAEPSDYPNVVYLCAIGGGASAASVISSCSKSLDGGATFIPTGAPAFYDDPTQSGDFGVPGLCNGANAHGFAGSDGTVYLPRGWCGQPWLAISKDEGTTWTRVQVSDLGMPCCAEVEEGVEGKLYSHETAVVADDKGNVFYAWVAADRVPYLVVSRDGGESWGKPLMIGPPGLKESLLPGMAIGPRGGLAIRYLGSENSPWNGTEMTDSPDMTEWNAYITTVADPLAKKPVLYTSTVNAKDEPLWVGPCGPDPIRCGWGDFQDVVIDHEGTVWSIDVDLCAGKKGCDQGESIVGRISGGPKL